MSQSRRTHLKWLLGGLIYAASAPMWVPTGRVRAATNIGATASLLIPERIVIQTIGVDAKIVTVGPTKLNDGGKVSLQWNAPNNSSVGWHNYSGHLGEGRNIVLNGHNNIYGSVFRKLYTLKAGDKIQLSAGALTVTYQVDEVLILQEKGVPLAARLRNARYIQPLQDDRLTVVSCWPETSNTHRVIVIARPVSA